MDSKEFIIWKREQREKCSETQRNRCFWCSKITSPEERTLEHYIPISFGGRSDKGNCRMACYSCNHQRGRVTLFIKKCCNKLRKMSEHEQERMRQEGRQLAEIIEMWNDIHRQHRLYQLVFPTTVEKILGR